MTSPAPVLAMRGVSRRIDGREILSNVDWTVDPGQRWIVLGQNGCGKTTLIRIASLWLHPSAGTVTVLGHDLGHTDVRTLRSRVAFASAALANQLRPQITAREVVMTGRNAALEPWWHDYDDADRARADTALHRVGVNHLADRAFGVLSAGERQRVLLARALGIEPKLILLDEPTAALDLAGRENLVSVLADLAADPTVAPIVLVTHHVEEIPDGFTHVLLLRDGAVQAAGELAATLTAENLSECFGVPLSLERRRGRWTAWHVDESTYPDGPPAPEG